MLPARTTVVEREHFYDLFILIHVFMGFLINSSKSIVYLPTLGVFVLGLVSIINTRNKGQIAGVLAGYLVGMEILLRMSRITLPYEFTKYAVAILLLAGLVIEKRPKPVPKAVFIYFLLLIPSCFLLDLNGFNQIRRMLSFNLSGPISLTLSMLYFYKREMSIEQLKKIVVAMLGPLMSLSIYLSITASDFSAYTYKHSANFTMSGGFGPNQVSIAFGLGISLFFIFFLYNKALFKRHLLSMGFLAILTFRGILTFSRGGFLGPFFALIATLVILKLRGKKAGKRGNSRETAFLAGLIAIAIVGWMANKITHDVLFERFMGRTETVGRVNYLSGRDIIMFMDLEIFKKHPLLGIGPGQGAELRDNMGFAGRVAAHNELTRLLAEHGLLGGAALLILLGYSIRKLLFENTPREELILASMCLALSFFSMSHSAMRIAVMGFVFGLAFIKLSGMRGETRLEKSLLAGGK
jgi:hypothetical protein